MALTQKRLKELVSYDPTTGVFVANVRTGGKIVPGSVLGTLKDGYVRISLDNELHYAHRLAFLYMTGLMPDEVDHEDRCRSNNRWKNLREATHSQNAINTPVRITSKTQVKNVSALPWGRFRVRLKRAGVVVFDKAFPTMHAAIVARDQFFAQEA